uniref:Uncharacterized protein n=1 Tax=Gopherus agassizii TaxID=38772 RepID=A0A452I904_9SAUR
MRLAWSSPDGPGAGGQETQEGLPKPSFMSGVVLYSELQ